MQDSYKQRQSTNWSNWWGGHQSWNWWSLWETCLHRATAPTVQAAVKTGLSYWNDTIVAFFFAAYNSRFFKFNILMKSNIVFKGTQLSSYLMTLDKLRVSCQMPATNFWHQIKSIKKQDTFNNLLWFCELQTVFCEKSSPTAMPFLLPNTLTSGEYSFFLPSESWVVNSNTRLDLKEVQLINNIGLFFSWKCCGYTSTYIFGNFSVTSCTEVSEPSSIIAKLRSEKKPVNKSIMMINNVTTSFRNNGHGQILQSIACSKIDELYLCVFQFLCINNTRL